MLSSKLGQTVFCPVCAAGREKPQLDIPVARFLWIAALWGTVVGGAIGVGGNPALGLWLGFVLAVLCFIGLEVYYTFKFRRELACPVCHFDPLLYRRSPEEAKKRCLEGLKTKDAALLTKLQQLRKQAN